jgi:hypothetical protein
MLARRIFAAAFGGLVATTLGLAFAVSLEACGSGGGDSTGGKRVVLATRLTMAAEAASAFTNTEGWSISLTKAAVAAGPFYYFDGAPPLVRNEQNHTWEYAARALGLGVARAHPGHYQAGNALGQMLESSSVDLLGGPAKLPDGDGITGIYRSGRFTLAAPNGPARSLLDGHTVLAEGTAEKDGKSRHFRAQVDLEVIAKHASQGKVEGCELEEVDVEGDGTITVTVLPQVWFDLVDFTDLAEGAADAPADFPEDSMAQLGFVIGVTQLSAYKFSLEPN